MNSIVRMLFGALPIAALVMAAPVLAQTAPAQPAISGSWYYDEQDGHGFNVEVLDGDRLLVYWYTYRPDRTSTFMLAVAERNGGEYTGELIQPEGMAFGDFDPNDFDPRPWGSITLGFDDCNAGSISWAPNDEAQAAGYTAGSIPVQRLTAIAGLPCNDVFSVVGNYAITFSDDGRRLIGRALFLPDRTFYYQYGDFGPEVVGGGTWELNQQNAFRFRFDGTSYVYGDGSAPLSEASFSGLPFLTREGFTSFGTAQPSGVRQDSFDLLFSAEDLADTYRMVDELANFQIGNVTIDAAGVVTGTLINGCALGGSVIQQTPGANQLAIDMRAGDAGDEVCADTEFVGAGLVIEAGDALSTSDLLEAYLVSEPRGYASVYRFYR